LQNVIIEDWQPRPKNSLRGYARVRFPSGLIVHDVHVHVHESGRAWASPRSREAIDNNGVAMKGADGKLVWKPVLAFTDRKTQSAWSKAVIDALRAAHPDALPPEGDAG
jgi:hypothetical protein